MRWLVAAVLVAVTMTGGRATQAGALIFYPDRASFDVAEPGLPVQSFDSANLGGQPYAIQANPLRHATNDSVFAKGSILPGIVIRTLHPGLVASALIVCGCGPVGAISVGDNWFGDTLTLNFPGGVMAVAGTVFANTSSGASYAGPISVAFLDGRLPLGGRTLHETAGGAVFFGAASASLPITRVTIVWDGNQDATTYVSDIAFGTPVVPFR